MGEVVYNYQYYGNDLIASEANCKIAKVQSGIINTAQLMTRNIIHIPLSDV